MTETSPGPKFTVVLNTFNRAQIVPDAVRSVLDQTWSDFELLVVDDGSSDGTADAIARFSDERVRYIHRPNGGLAAARNTGLREARGEFVTFMDDDDLVRPVWLERMASALGRSGAAVVSCGTEIRRMDGSILELRLPHPLGTAFDDQVGLFLPGTFAVRRDVLDDVGGYWEEIRCSEQTELSLRVLPHCTDHGLVVTSVPEALVITNRDTDERRPLRRADWLAVGALAILRRHGRRLRRSPRTYADFAAVAAVQCARMGRYREARSLLRDAVKAEPTRPKNLARLALACVPPLGRQAWGTWADPSEQAVRSGSQPATAPRRRRPGPTSIARRTPGARAVIRRLRPPAWPVERSAVIPPAAPPDWLTGPPDFVGIGAQRAGTTWWYALIAEHPSVHVNPTVPKEIHFFDRFHSAPFDQAAVATYHSLFPRPAGSLIGEWTPEYMIWPWCPPLLARAGVPKLIVCLRDPVERFHAGYTFSVRRGAPAVPTIAGDAFHRGLYHRQLSLVLEHFKRDQLLVLQYETCLADPVGQLRLTYEFLGIDSDFAPEEPEAPVKAIRPKPPLEPGLRAILKEAYRSDLELLAEDFPEIDLGRWPSFVS